MLLRPSQRVPDAVHALVGFEKISFPFIMMTAGGVPQKPPEIEGRKVCSERRRAPPGQETIRSMSLWRFPGWSAPRGHPSAQTSFHPCSLAHKSGNRPGHPSLDRSPGLGNRVAALRALALSSSLGNPQADLMDAHHPKRHKMGCSPAVQKIKNNRFESLPFPVICEKSHRRMMPGQQDWLKLELDFLFCGGNGALVKRRKRKN